MSTEYVAPGVEIHHKHTPTAEKPLQFALCYLEHRGSGVSVWYALRRARTRMGAARMIDAQLRNAPNRRRTQYHVWDTEQPWDGP